MSEPTDLHLREWQAICNEIVIAGACPIPCDPPRRVYVAGPYTADTPEEVERNVEAALAAAERLRAAGYVPFVPHLAHYWHARHPAPYEAWMAWCLAWLARCDAVVLFAPSPGARRECMEADRLGIRVFHSVHEALLESAP